MHRLIVTSATYRQSSKARPELADKDARNLLLARQSRVRVGGRDRARCGALRERAVSIRTIGGPSVRPPQPDGVYSFTQNKERTGTPTCNGPTRYRRGLYTHVLPQSAASAAVSTFDAPDFSATSAPVAARSNTPFQALKVA